MNLNDIIKSWVSMLASVMLTVYAYIDDVNAILKCITLVLSVITGLIIMLYWWFKLKKEKAESEISDKVNKQFNKYKKIKD